MAMNRKFGLIGSITLVCRDKNGNVKWTNEASDKIPNYGMVARLNAMLKQSNAITPKAKGVVNLLKLITNTGMAEVAGLILTDVGGTAFDVVGMGDSGTAESAAHTDLQASTNKDRKAGTGTRVTTTQTNDTAQVVATFATADGPTGTWSVQEAAMFNNTTGGIMLFRKIFTAKSVDWDAGDTLEITAKCQVKQGS